VLALLRWAQNPRGRIAGFRVLQLLPGVGPKTAARLLDSTSEGDAINAIREFKPPSTTIDHWSDFIETISLLHKESVGWPHALELACKWYAPHLERIYDDAMMRQADLEQLAQIAFAYPSQEQFLTELTLDPPDATSDKAGAPLLDEDYLISRPFIRLRARNGGLCLFSIASTAAFRRILPLAPQRKLRRNAAYSTWQ